MRHVTTLSRFVDIRRFVPLALFAFALAIGAGCAGNFGSSGGSGTTSVPTLTLTDGTTTFTITGYRDVVCGAAIEIDVVARRDDGTPITLEALVDGASTHTFNGIGLFNPAAVTLAVAAPLVDIDGTAAFEGVVTVRMRAVGADTAEVTFDMTVTAPAFRLIGDPDRLFFSTPGQTHTLRVYERTPTGPRLPANGVSFASTDASIATVDLTGLVTAIADGHCEIVLTRTGAISARVPVTVGPDLYFTDGFGAGSTLWSVRTTGTNPGAAASIGTFVSTTGMGGISGLRYHDETAYLLQPEQGFGGGNLSGIIGRYDLRTGTYTESIWQHDDATGARLSNPQDIAFLSPTRAFISNYNNDTVTGGGFLSLYDPTTDAVTGVVAMPNPSGVGTLSPGGMAIWQGYLFVCCSGFNQSTFAFEMGTVQVWNIEADPPTFVTSIETSTLTGPGGSVVSGGNPASCAIGHDGLLYVNCAGEFFGGFDAEIQVYDPGTLDPSGAANAPLATASLGAASYTLSPIVQAPTGHLYVGSSNNALSTRLYAVRAYDPASGTLPIHHDTANPLELAGTPGALTGLTLIPRGGANDAGLIVGVATDYSAFTGIITLDPDGDLAGLGTLTSTPVAAFGPGYVIARVPTREAAFAEQWTASTGLVAGFGNELHALGAPQGAGTGAGSVEVVGLSDPTGELVLHFKTTRLVDRPGADLVVFENAFWIGSDPRSRWMEVGRVAVSQDGVTWFEWPIVEDTAKTTLDPTRYLSGFTGREAVFTNPATAVPANNWASGGDRLDLAALAGLPGFPAGDQRWFRYVRIRDHAGDGASPDIDGIAALHWQAD